MCKLQFSSNLNLKINVILLVDVFGKHRKLYEQVFGLDPCHFFSTANTIWDKMFKSTPGHIKAFWHIRKISAVSASYPVEMNGTGRKTIYSSCNKHNFWKVTNFQDNLVGITLIF